MWQISSFSELKWTCQFWTKCQLMGVALITKFILEFEMTILILGKTSDQGRSFENAYFLSSLKHDFSSEKLLEDLVYYIWNERANFGQNDSSWAQLWINRAFSQSQNKIRALKTLQLSSLLELKWPCSRCGRAFCQDHIGFHFEPEKRYRWVDLCMNQFLALYIEI